MNIANAKPRTPGPERRACPWPALRQGESPDSDRRRRYEGRRETDEEGVARGKKTDETAEARRAAGAVALHASMATRYSDTIVRKPDSRLPQRGLPADGQVRNEQELLPAFVDVGLQAIVRSPRLFLDDHCYCRVRSPIRTRATDLDEARAHVLRVVVGIQIEVGDAEQAAIAARRVEYRFRPEVHVRDDHFGIVRCHDGHGAIGDHRHFAVGAIDLDPI